MRDTWIRVVRAPSTGQPDARPVKRVEFIREGNVFGKILASDVKVELPVSGPAYLTLSTPFFEEVFEEKDAPVEMPPEGY